MQNENYHLGSFSVQETSINFKYTIAQKFGVSKSFFFFFVRKKYFYSARMH